MAEDADDADHLTCLTHSVLNVAWVTDQLLTTSNLSERSGNMRSLVLLTRLKTRRVVESSGTARNSDNLFSNVELRMFCFREPQTHYTLTPSEFCTMTTSCFYITMFSPDQHKGHFIYLHEHLITSRKITHCSFNH